MSILLMFDIHIRSIRASRFHSLIPLRLLPLHLSMLIISLYIVHHLPYPLPSFLFFLLLLHLLHRRGNPSSTNWIHLAHDLLKLGLKQLVLLISELYSRDNSIDISIHVVFKLASYFIQKYLLLVFKLFLCIWLMFAVQNRLSVVAS